MQKLLVFAALGLTACGGSDKLTTLSLGQWGGQNVQLDATAMGATLTFKCGATGTISQPLQLDAAAHFDAAGVYEPRLVQGGPRTARYVGSVSGSSMSLSVGVSNGSLGPFLLHQGQPGAFEVCNFGA
jgi:hypothetical protein